MTLRELLDAATPGPWTPGAKWRTIQGATTQAVNDPDGNEVGHSWFTPDDARLIALAPELASLVLDMADALDNLAIESKRYFLVCRACGAMDERPVTTLEHSESCYVGALLARLDRISTQTQDES